MMGEGEGDRSGRDGVLTAWSRAARAPARHFVWVLTAWSQPFGLLLRGFHEKAGPVKGF